MEQDIQTTIERRGLIARGDHVLAAVSGGADSIALMHVLERLRSRLGFTLSVAHLHHGLRGADADADERFVQDQASALELSCVTAHVDVSGIAKAERVSIEMAARQARYAFLADVAVSVDAGSIATGHTFDDQAETVLLRLARGTGLTGLAGIPHSSHMHRVRVIRPLRDCRRSDVEAFLRDAGIPWREDDSNLDVSVPRNRIRHQVLPMLARDLNPGIASALVRTAEILGTEDEWMNETAKAEIEAVRSADDPDALEIRALGERPLPMRRRVVRLWLAAAGVPVEHLDFDLSGRIEALIESREGTSEVPVGDGYDVVRSYGLLRIRADRLDDPVPFLERLVIPGETRLPECGCRVRSEETIGILTTGPTEPGLVPAAGSLGRVAVGDSAVFARSRRPGDRIRPTGMSGSVKLQDLFVNHKIPRARRPRVPVFTCRDEIVWIPGYRVARGWEVPDTESPSLSFFVDMLGGP